MTIRRRDVLAGTAAALVQTGCSPRPAEPARVSILRAANYSADLTGELRRLFLDHKLDVRGKRIVLKPNLVEFDAGTTINTHPAVVLAALEALRSLGAAQVTIAEGPGHRRNTIELAEAAGYFQTVPNFETLFTDLNLDDVSPVTLSRPAGNLKTVYLPQTVLRCDLLVSLAKMKTHHWVGATLSMKNLFGLVPGAIYGWPKNVLHWAGIERCIVGLNAAFPRVFAIVDGIVGMEGNGPIQGAPKHAGVLVGGPDRVAVDATCCRIMGIDPEKVGYLELAADGGRTLESNVQQIGEPVRSVQSAFELIPEFRNLRLPPAS